MSIFPSCWVNLASSTVLPCSDHFPNSSISTIELSRLILTTGVSQFRFCRLRRTSTPTGNVKTLTVARPISPSIVSALVASVSSAPPPQDSLGDGESEDTGRKVDRVVISTTKHSRTTRAISNEPEYVSERYVKGSLKFQVELSNSFCLEETTSVVDEIDGQNYEDFSLESSGTEGNTIIENEEGLWRSESYHRQALKSKQSYKEVILRFSTKNSPVDKLLSNNVHIHAPDTGELHSGTPAGTSPSEQLIDEEEFYLRRALNAKRQAAAEIFESSLKAGLLGPMFTKTLISFMPKFIDRIVTEAVVLKRHRMHKELSFNSRARLYISSNKVVELIKWLKHQNLTAPRIGKLICTADESFGLIRSRVEWLKTIYVRGRDLGVIIERYPKILKLSFKDFIKTVEVLETAGVQRKWLGLVVSRQPHLLTLGDDKLLEKISMITELGISTEQFGIMVFKFPALLGHFSVEEMQSKVDYLRQIGLEDAVLVKIIASTPQLLACSIEQSWAKLLRYFYFLRIELSGVRRILGVNPSVFCLNLEENIAPKVKFLRAIGVDEGVIGQLIVDFPAILTYSLEKKIRPVVRFLLEEGGVKEEKVGKVITIQPELIRCSLPNKLLVLVKYLRSKGISSQQLGRMIEDFPALLMYSVPVLHPKFQFLIRIMKCPMIDVVTFPRYFSYSLKSRIIPRYELLKEKGLSFSLRQMLACSDDIFHKRVQQQRSANLTSSTAENPNFVLEGRLQPCTSFSDLNKAV